MAIYLDQTSTPELGILPSNTAAQNRPALLAELPNSNRHIAFPAGDYQVDNATVISITNFEGRLTFHPRARLVFTDSTKRGMIFDGSAVIDGWNSTFTTLPPIRVAAEECLEFRNGATDVTIENVRITGSAAAGLLFNECIRPRVLGARIADTKADGLHFANCQDPVAISINTYNTGDDGLAFLNYADRAAYQGGYACGVTIKNSEGRGITVLGQSNVIIEGFYVENTKWQGIMCQYDPPWNTRTPDRVVFVNGIVRLGGAKDSANLQHGAYYSEVGELTFDNVYVESPGARGFAGLASAGRLTVANCHVYNATGSDGNGFVMSARTLVARSLVAQDCGSYGFFLYSSDLVEFDNLTTIDCSKNNTLRRAIWFENNARVDGSNLHVIDLQATPTGYIVGSFGIQSGGIGDVTSLIPNGTPSIENNSGLNLGTVDGRPSKRVSADHGDANVTLTMKDLPIQRFATNLTANRTVTLPTTGVYNGAVFRIVRAGLGAFTLNVGGLKTIPANTAAFVDLAHDGTAWRLTGYGTL